MHRKTFFAPLAAVALLGLSGCETYEFPPRLSGAGTDDCPTCSEFVPEESRLPVGGVVTVSSRFTFEDEWGALSGVKVFVTTPSGRVLEENIDDVRTRPGFTCAFRAESLTTPVGTCDLELERETSIGSVAAVLDGIEQANLLLRFGAELSEIGEWTIEVQAERSTGVRSNRISTTFDVVEDVGDE